MDPNEPAPKSELEQQSERLSQLEAEEAKSASAPTKAPAKDDTTPAGDRAPAAGKTDGTKPDSSTKTTDTLSDAEKQETAQIDAAKTEAEKEGKQLKLDDKGKPARDAQGKFIKVEKSTPDDGKGKYAKDRERRDHSWQALNTEKTAFEAEKTKHATELKAERDKLAAERTAFEQQRQSANPTPEKYEQWSNAETAKAVDLENQAKAAEAAGDFEKADKLRQGAATAKGFAQIAREKAEQLRKNPPPTGAQATEQFIANQKEWVSKAVTDFPEFGKKDSPVQKDAADYYRQMTGQMPFLKTLPGFVYFCAERASLKSAADRVPALEKELGELKPKLAELEALTNPSPASGGNRLPGAKTFEQMSEEDQLNWLRQNAT